MWFLCAAAMAGPVFGEPGEPVFLPVGGNWARAFPTETGWHFLFAAGGEYNLLPMTEDLVVQDVNRTRLTGHTDLKDNQIAPCPDGTYLHAGSADLETPADTLYTFRYDASFNLLQTATIAERDATKRLNDPAVVCGGPGKTWLGAVDEHFSSILYEVPEDTTPPSAIAVPEFPFLQGGSLVYEAETDTLVAIGSGNGEPYYVRTGRDYVVGAKTSLGVAPEGLRAYWPQAVLRVDDMYLLAFMARDDAQNWSADTGNVFLAAFNLDWSLIEVIQVTDITPTEGAMRPSLAVKGDLLLVLYDRLTEMYITPIRLFPDGKTEDTGPGEDTGPTDSGAGDSGPGDSGTTDTDPPDTDPGGDTATAAATGCAGCAVGGSGGMGALASGVAAAVALVRRRRR